MQMNVGAVPRACPLFDPQMNIDPHGMKIKNGSGHRSTAVFLCVQTKISTRSLAIYPSETLHLALAMAFQVYGLTQV